MSQNNARDKTRKIGLENQDRLKLVQKHERIER